MPPDERPDELPPPPSQPPSRVGDYSQMVIADELVLDVGGLVYAGLQSTPWGEPRHITMQPKVRLLASVPNPDPNPSPNPNPNPNPNQGAPARQCAGWAAASRLRQLLDWLRPALGE